jgi:hypothetical protein
MDRTGKWDMARRADDCKPNLDGEPAGDRNFGRLLAVPADSDRASNALFTAVLDYAGRCANSHTVVTDLGIPVVFSCTDDGQTYAPFMVPD